MWPVVSRNDVSTVVEPLHGVMIGLKDSFVGTIEAIYGTERYTESGGIIIRMSS